MAAVTVVSTSARSPELLAGRKRFGYAVVSCAATGDTFAPADVKKVSSAQATPPSTVAVGVSISGNTITFNYTGGGAMANIQVMYVGV
jgi:hypothetical protein